MLCTSRRNPGPARRLQRAPERRAGAAAGRAARGQGTAGLRGDKDSPALREPWQPLGAPQAVPGTPRLSRAPPVLRNAAPASAPSGSAAAAAAEPVPPCQEQSRDLQPRGPASSGHWLLARTRSNKHIGPTGSGSYLSNFPDWEKMQNCTMFLGSCFLPLVSPQGTGDVTRSDRKC